MIVELLRDRGLLPQAPSLAALSRAQDWVAPADGSPDAAARAAELAAGLRAAGRRVDLQLEPHAAAAARDPAKARAAAAKRAAAAGAGRLLTAGADGAVAVRDLAAFADAAAPTVAAALALPPPA